MSIRSWAAAVITAAALVAVSVSTTYASVTATGFPPWLKPVAEKTLSAVWSEIQSSDPDLNKSETMRIVIPRLLKGYEISSIEEGENDISLSFSASGKVDWSVEMSFPKLNAISLEWFSEDVRGLEEKFLSLVNELPLDALVWADKALSQEIISVVEDRLSGWKPDILIKIDKTGAVLEVGFTPASPLILALDPVIDSSSLPIILQNRLKESLLTGQSDLIGLPVAWVEQHKEDLEENIRAFLLKRNTVDRARARVKVDVQPGQIARMNTSVESSRYSLYAWFAAYVGTDDRYGELGIHIGRRAQIFPWWDVELYGESLTAFNDLDTETRLGLIWSPYEKIWIGTEFSTSDEQFWWRVNYQGGYNRPYLDWRYSENSDHNWGIGWKVNQFFSLELHYDDRDDDSLSLKVINNL